MIALVCESSTLLGSIALFKDNQLLAYRESLRQGSHTNVVNTYVDDVLTSTNLKLSAVDLFVSGVGPGSFTGIRISLNLIKTLAYCHSKPVLGINSLENLASQVVETNLPIICMINAYKNMVYIAEYSNSSGVLLQIRPPEVVRVQELVNYITHTCFVVGDGHAAYSQYLQPSTNALIKRPAAPQDEPKANAISKLILSRSNEATHWSNFLPLYLRASEAEEVQQGIKYQSLV